MSAINRKSCEENFQRSLMKWRKIRQYISHEFNTQMGSESNPAHKNSTEQESSQQEGTESHNSDFDSPQTTLDLEFERPQHAIQQPTAPAYRRWAKIRKQISECGTSPPTDGRPADDLSYESRPMLQPQKTFPTMSSQSSCLKQPHEEKTTNLDNIENQLSLLLSAIKVEKTRSKACYTCSTCTCRNGRIRK